MDLETFVLPGLPSIGNSAYSKTREVALEVGKQATYNGNVRGAMNISPFLSMHCPCNETLPLVNKQLKEAGLRTVQTFDLHSAMTDAHGCSCPNHGTDECDCQMVVLLVYGTATEPVTLLLHGNSKQTWISIADSILQHPNPQLKITIQKALEGKESEFGL